MKSASQIVELKCLIIFFFIAISGSHLFGQISVFTNMKIHFLDVPIDGKTVNYFRADQVLVKVGENADGLIEIEDIIIFENKLSFGTPLSKNQIEAVKARAKLTIGGKNDPQITYKSSTRDDGISNDDVEDFLKLGKPLGAKVRFKKVHDGADGKEVTGIADLP